MPMIGNRRDVVNGELAENWAGGWRFSRLHTHALGYSRARRSVSMYCSRVAVVEWQVAWRSPLN